MPDYSRRTHIVRISDAKAGEPPSDTYIDIEVLDAISFRVANGHEVVLSMEASNSNPYTVDDTGGGHEKHPSDATQRTHMKRVTNKADPTQQLDIEVMDIIALQDQNGDEWILDMKATTGEGPDVFDATDDSGSSSSTRRVHDEIITSPFGKTKKDAGKDYVTSQRVDNIAFRTIEGREVVFSCPSNDDPHSSDPRASTYLVSPKGYDPNNDDGPEPPANKDGHTYVAFVKDAAGFLTADEKLQMGPFWWIRKISSSKYFVRIDMGASNFVNGSPTAPEPPTFTIDVGDPKDGQPHAKLIDKTDPKVFKTSNPGTQSFLYFVWPDFAPLPTKENFGNITPVGNYAGQFSTSIICDTGSIPRPNLDGNGAGGAGGGDINTGLGYDPFGPGFQTLAAAQYYANVFNLEYSGTIPSARGPQGFFEGYYAADGTIVRIHSEARVSAHALEIDFGAFGSTSVQQSFLFKIPTPKTVFKITVTGTLKTGSNFASGYGYSDSKKAIKVVADTAIPASSYGGGGTFDPPDGAIPDTPYDPDIVIASAGIDTVYTITSEVVKNADPATPKKPHHVALTITNDAPKGGPAG